MNLTVNLNNVNDVLPKNYQKVVAIGKNGVMYSGQYINGLFECDDNEIYGTVGAKKIEDAMSFEVLYWVAEDDFNLEKLNALMQQSKKKDYYETIYFGIIIISMFVILFVDNASWVWQTALGFWIGAAIMDIILHICNKKERG